MSSKKSALIFCGLEGGIGRIRRQLKSGIIDVYSAINGLGMLGPR
jgi:hypothetical protein